MSDSLDTAIRLNDDRRRNFPDVSFFGFAKKELLKISSAVADHGRLTVEEYDSLNIGVMCARELENSDMDYCNVIYRLLDNVRPTSNETGRKGECDVR